MSSHRRRTVIAAVALLLGPLVGGCSDDQPTPSLPAGRVLDATSIWEQHAQTMRLPHLDLDVRTSLPVADLAAFDQGDPSTVVEGGGSFVGLSMNYRYDPRLDEWVDVRHRGFAVALRVDGRRYPVRERVGAPGPDGDTLVALDTYVAVKAAPESIEPDDVVVEVTYDGLTQSVAMGSGTRVTPGASRWLYIDHHMQTDVCPGYVSTTRRLEGATTNCTVTWWTRPYDRNGGWAKDSGEYAYVSIDLSHGLSIRRRGAGGRGTWYRPTELATSATLDGRRPVRPAGPGPAVAHGRDARAGTVPTLVFETQPGDHRFRASFRWDWARGRRGQGPRILTLSFDTSHGLAL